MADVIVFDALRKSWLHFYNPVEVVQAFRTDEVVSKLRHIEHAVNSRGLHAAGFLSYEASPAFDTALRVRSSQEFPLLWFGLYPEPEVRELPAAVARYSLGDWIPSIGRDEYDTAICRIRRYIAEGETYQVNFSFRFCARFEGDARGLFADLHLAQQSSYAAFIRTEEFALCSSSPELFFRLDGREMTTRPMKGTAHRGLWPTDDKQQAELLRHSEKNRAENLMIVDMMRNDMGRIAEVGSVAVPSLFNVERYPTVLQMTSTVTGRTHTSVTEILAALFPCASITGAPKARTMEIIAELENTPRRIYTGSIGHIAPDRQAQFNLAIRTILVDTRKNEAEYGVGGGVVWDSTSADEYDECLLKARVLTERRPAFSLFETLLWTPEQGWLLIRYHLKRLQDSAAYFGMMFHERAVLEKLHEVAAGLSSKPHKVRIVLHANGNLEIASEPATENTAHTPVRLRRAISPVDSKNLFLYHKTTHRQVYQDALATTVDCDDVLLWNEKGEVTETTIANLVFELDGQLVTPPIACGLLAGTYRAWLLDQKKVRENVVKVVDLVRCTRIAVVNSVRKWQEAQLQY